MPTCSLYLKIGAKVKKTGFKGSRRAGFQGSRVKPSKEQSDPISESPRPLSECVRRGEIIHGV
jgi:hypothetical protein